MYEQANFKIPDKNLLSELILEASESMFSFTELPKSIPVNTLTSAKI